MILGNKFRIYPTRDQQQTLLRWIGCQRFVFNAKVAEDRYFRRFARKALALCGLRVPMDQQYAHFITEQSAFLREVPSQVLRNGAFRWRTAYQRYFSGAVKGRPKFRKKIGRQSVMLTSELFRIEQREAGVVLHVGTRKFPLGAIPVCAHRRFEGAPGAISVSVEGGHWHVSFATEDGRPELNDAEIAEALQGFSEADLLARAVGIDRGVAIPAAVSNGETFDFSAIQKKRQAGAQKHRRRWQRRAARRQKGSSRQRKALRRAACYQRYGTNVRNDMAHKASRALVDNPDAYLFVFEDLKTKNMTSSAKGDAERPGRNVRQKAGLNRAILQSAWGKLKLFTEYKARRAGKLAIAVAPHHSSQECRLCGHTHPDNRPSQAEFVCRRCGHAENADFNAAGVLQKRGVKALLAGEITFKVPRKSGIRKQLGPERPEATPVGEGVSRQRRKSQAQSSLNRETPTTTSRKAV